MLYAAYTPPATGLAARSAIVDLIQGIYETYPAHARKIVRNRIYATAVPTPMCQAMGKVAAKRITAGVAPFASGVTDLPEAAKFSVTDVLENEAIRIYGIPRESPVSREPSDPPEISDAPKTLATPLSAMNLALTLAGSVVRKGELYDQARPVGAVLVDARGNVLGTAINTNARNRTLHAEINLIQNYDSRHGLPLPAGCAIYVSLKPCKMCAAMIGHAAGPGLGALRVLYAEDDPGPQARHTFLDQVAGVQTHWGFETGSPVGDVQRVREF